MFAFKVLLILLCINYSVAEVEIRIGDGVIRAKQISSAEVIKSPVTAATIAAIAPTKKETETAIVEPGVFTHTEDGTDNGETFYGELTSDTEHLDNPESVINQPPGIEAAQRMEDNLEDDGSLDLLTIIIITIVIALVILLVAAFFVINKYVDFPCIKTRDFLEKHCCWCCVDKVNAIQVDDDDDCKIDLDVYAHRNSILYSQV